MKFSFRKTILSFLVLSLFADCLQASSKLTVYVCAHQDDWQLFMGVDAYSKISNSSDTSRVVIIYVTAGDYHDCINGLDTQAIPYYLSREQGAKNSVELAANSHKKRYCWENDTIEINHHLLIRNSYHFVSSYFLRLADGNMDGSRNISLKNFHINRFTNNYSIDSLTCYKDWNNLFRTCENILQNEIRRTDEVQLNLFDTSQIQNPEDHSDHYETGSLFINALRSQPLTRIAYEGYISGSPDKAMNLSPVEIMEESGLFAAYDQAMIDNNYPSIWNSDYLRFCDKNYFRILSDKPETGIDLLKIGISIFLLFVLGTGLFYYYFLRRN